MMKQPAQLSLLSEIIHQTLSILQPSKSQKAGKELRNRTFMNGCQCLVYEGLITLFLN
jgi:hypothetical protein